MKWIVPAIICAAMGYALYRKAPVYTTFISGAGEGLKILVKILPPMLAIMSAVYMLRASGALDMLLNLIKPVTDRIGLPAEVLPLALIRPLSGSGAMGIFADILNEYGADSEIGRIASVINGSTETTFYCLCVYFASTRVKNNLKAVPCAVIGDIIAIIMSVITVKLFKF